MIFRLRELVEIVGVCAVVLSLLFVGYELRQTQKTMLADSSNVRAEMSIVRIMAVPGFRDIVQKASNGEELTKDEIESVRLRNSIFLRYLENLHYHWQLGLLDEEIWESNLNGLRNLVNGQLFELTTPELFGTQAGSYRASFIDLARSLREDR